MDAFVPIKNFDGYLIDKIGRVFSLKSNRFLNTHKDKKGYITICLNDNNIRYKFFIHRLVAIAFIPNTENKATINHKDGNKQNNHISNLEWMTLSENNIHAFEIGLKKRAKEREKGYRIRFRGNYCHLKAYYKKINNGRI